MAIGDMWPRVATRWYNIELTAYKPKNRFMSNYKNAGNRGGEANGNTKCSVAVLQARNHWGGRGGGFRIPPNKKLDGPPQLFDEECDYCYITDCSARNWVYHPYFVPYNNPRPMNWTPTLKTWLRPCCFVADVFVTVEFLLF